MSEVPQHLPEPECGRARTWMAGLVDGDLSTDQAAWLRGHLDGCAECRAALARFAEIDSELIGWGQRLGQEHPAPAAAREQLAARLGPRPGRRRVSRWIPAAAAAAAAALAVAVILPHRPPHGTPHRTPQPGDRGVNRREAAFIEIPYLEPLDPRENATIVRMNIRVATLLAAGYRVTADPDRMVPADVLVGEDGRAHAVRVLSDIDWKGTGD